MKMSKVMSIRLPEEDLKLVNELAQDEDMEKSAAVRQLIRSGRIYLAITKYQEGKISLGRAAGMAYMSLSNFMELLSNLGIESKIERNDYIEGLKHLKEVF